MIKSKFMEAFGPSNCFATVHDGVKHITAVVSDDVAVDMAGNTVTDGKGYALLSTPGLGSPSLASASLVKMTRVQQQQQQRQRQARPGLQPQQVYQRRGGGGDDDHPALPQIDEAAPPAAVAVQSDVPLPHRRSVRDGSGVVRRSTSRNSSSRGEGDGGLAGDIGVVAIAGATATAAPATAQRFEESLGAKADHKFVASNVSAVQPFDTDAVLEEFGV